MIGDVQTFLAKIWRALYKSGYCSRVTQKMLKPLYHDQYSCGFVNFGVLRPCSSRLGAIPIQNAYPVPPLQNRAGFGPG